MSVATRNPFAVLDEDSSPSTPPPPPPDTQPSAPSTRGNQRARGGPASRGGRYYQRGGASNNAAPTGDEPAPAQDAPKRKFDGERREGRGRGRGGPRGRGRTYDRHSATGKTDSDKKVHNSWGGDDANAELKVEEAATIDAAAESGTGINDWAAPGPPAAADGDWGAPAPAADAGDWGAPTPAVDPSSPADAEKPDPGRRRDRDAEEDDNTLTLDQYLAQQKEKENALVPKLEGRKANEGDDTLWNGATRLEKGDGEAYFTGKTKTASKSRTEKKEKVFIEIDARFERPSRGGRGRGGDRGEGRGRGGRGGRGGFRGGRGGLNGAAAAINVDDETAFPSLS